MEGVYQEEFWYSDAAFLRQQFGTIDRSYWSGTGWTTICLVLNPAPWHASIVAVHLVAVWLVFKISRRLAGDSTSALLAASAFALTPVHVAAVVWMAGCGMVLATALTLAAFYLIMPRRMVPLAQLGGCDVAIRGRATFPREHDRVSGAGRMLRVYFRSQRFGSGRGG